MAETRVPPAVTFSFERYVAEVCHRAKLDDHEWPLKARELLSHLQERWREGVDGGLNDADAQERAIQLFGQPVDVARRLRQSWLRRLLYHQKCRPHRYVVFLTACLSGTLIMAVEVLLTNDKDIPVDFIVGAFTNGFLAVGALMVIQWRPPLKPVWLGWLLSIRHVLWFFVVSGFINAASTPLKALWPLIVDDFPLVIMMLFLGPICLGFIGAACLLSEALDFAGRRKSKTDELLAFKIIR